MRTKFYHREDELEFIYEEWKSVARNSSPKAILIYGNSGIGKTRLIQEFYGKIAKNQLYSNYWQNDIFEENKPLNIVPSISPNSVGEIPEWFWFATRCISDTNSYKGLDTYVAFNKIRLQFGNHLGCILKLLDKRDKNRKLTKSVVSLLTNFTLPGSGQVVEIINILLDGLGSTIDTYDVFDDAKKRLQKGNETGIQHSLSALTIKVFEILYGDKNDLKVPLVIYVDDAHWIDEPTRGIITDILKAADLNNWPILVIFSCWSEAIHELKNK